MFVDSLLHYVTCIEIAKDVWDNFCATFEKRHVDNVTTSRALQY